MKYSPLNDRHGNYHCDHGLPGKVRLFLSHSLHKAPKQPQTYRRHQEKIVDDRVGIVVAAHGSYKDDHQYGKGQCLLLPAAVKYSGASDNSQNDGDYDKHHCCLEHAVIVPVIPGKYASWKEESNKNQKPQSIQQLFYYNVFTGKEKEHDHSRRKAWDHDQHALCSGKVCIYYHADHTAGSVIRCSARHAKQASYHFKVRSRAVERCDHKKGHHKPQHISAHTDHSLFEDFSKLLFRYDAVEPQHQDHSRFHHIGKAHHHVESKAHSRKQQKLVLPLPLKHSDEQQQRSQRKKQVGEIIIHYHPGTPAKALSHKQPDENHPSRHPPL